MFARSCKRGIRPKLRCIKYTVSKTGSPAAVRLQITPSTPAILVDYDNNKFWCKESSFDQPLLLVIALVTLHINY